MNAFKIAARRCLRSGQLLAVVAAAAVGAVLLPGSAAATTGPASSSMFKAQATALGMSADQAGLLQHEVDQYLARVGGRQIAINKIDLDGAGVLVVALPDAGSQVASTRTATSLARPASNPACYGGDLCLYSGLERAGTYAYYYACRTVPNPFSTDPVGSFVNNQSSGTVSLFYAPSGSVYYTSTAYTSTTNIVFRNVARIKVC